MKDETVFCATTMSMIIYYDNNRNWLSNNNVLNKLCPNSRGTQRFVRWIPIREERTEDITFPFPLPRQVGKHSVGFRHSTCNASKGVKQRIKRSVRQSVLTLGLHSSFGFLCLLCY